MATDFPVLRQRILPRLYASKFPNILMTADSGSATTIVDAAAALPGATVDLLNYCWVKVVRDAGAAGAAPQTDVRAVSEGGYVAASGTITVSAAFSSSSQ